LKIPLPPIVFIDRDGTLIREHSYLSDPRLVELLDGGAEAIRLLNRLNIRVALVTNQSGIGRGLFTYEHYEAVHKALDCQLNQEGAFLTAHVYCPATKEQDWERRRKPSATMFWEAAQQAGVNPWGAAFVGDQLRDVIPAKRFDGSAWLVETGHPISRSVPVWIRRVPTLLDAVHSIVTERVLGSDLTS
jgi:D-glycero-D-manno-heptose 1,7-bisphosphate phosphatase